MLVSAVSMNSRENFSSKGKDAFRALASEARGLGVRVEERGESLKTLRAKITEAKTAKPAPRKNLAVRVLEYIGERCGDGKSGGGRPSHGGASSGGGRPSWY